jgi:ABC-type Fe3+ transport system permease subunit
MPSPASASFFVLFMVKLLQSVVIYASIRIYQSTTKNKKDWAKGKNKMKKNIKKATTATYNALFNSLFTALLALVILSGLAVFGAMHFIGKSPVAVAMATLTVVMLVSKVINKLSK